MAIVLVEKQLTKNDMDKFISIRRLSNGLFSVDISTNQFCGGYCRLFRFIGDALIFITEETGKDIPSNWPNLQNFDWKNDFNSWLF